MENLGGVNGVRNLSNHTIRLRTGNHFTWETKCVSNKKHDAPSIRVAHQNFIRKMLKQTDEQESIFRQEDSQMFILTKHTVNTFYILIHED